MTGPPQPLAALREDLVRRFGVAPGQVRFVRAPYRVCPLGAHIDHQRGPVTAMALDQGVLLAYAPSGSRAVRLESRDFPGTVAFDLDDVPGKQPGDWGNYPRGAARVLQGRHKLERGLVGVTAGKLHGGGVSSSAAVGVAYLLAFEEVNGLRVAPEENIRLDQEIENGYLGLRNGILDQAAILLSRRGHLTWIDCGTARYERLPAALDLPPFRVLLVFSGVRQALVATDYNRRVEECARPRRSCWKPPAATSLNLCSGTSRWRSTASTSTSCTAPRRAAPRIISPRSSASGKASRPGNTAI